MNRIARAVGLAKELTRVAGARPGGALHAPRPRAVHVAVGDPQAPFEHFLAILDARGLLDDGGRIAADVGLYAMGDFFDWGDAAEVDRAAADGLALLAWLAAHDPDQVHLVLGNHDLARVGELAGFDDATFREARRAALDAYARHDALAEKALLARFPSLPTAEAAARDFSTFMTAQRDLVVQLLRERRLRIAFAFGRDVLLTHAGVTLADVSPDVHGDHPDAPTVAALLDDRLEVALRGWMAGPGGPLEIPDLHVPGSAAHGEGGGIFYHRPTSHPIPVRPSRVLGRRFDPRRIPLGLTQVIGHIGHAKCRDLMPAWCDPRDPSDAAGEEGALRSLVTDGATARYRRGIAPNQPGEGRIVFTDGTMRRAAVGAYEILDLDTMTPFVPRSPHAATG